MAQVPDWSAGGIHVGRIQKAQQSSKTKLALEPKPTEGITKLTTWTPVGQVTTKQQNARRKQHPPENSNRAQNLTVHSKCRPGDPESAGKPKHRTFSAPPGKTQTPALRWRRCWNYLTKPLKQLLYTCSMKWRSTDLKWVQGQKFSVEK